MEESLFEFGIAALSASVSILVFGQKDAGAAFRTELVRARDFIAFDFVIIFHCHVTHSADSSDESSSASSSAASSSAASSAGSSGIVFLKRTWACSICFMRSSDWYTFA